VDVFIDPKTQRISNAKKVGLDLGKLLGLTALNMTGNGQVVKTSNQDALKSISTFYPELNYLIPKLLDYQSGIVLPTTDQFKQIYSVYTGRNISPDSVRQVIGADGLKTFIGTDETGQTYTYKENPNAFTVTPIWGTWTGPNSPNNSLPFTLLDTFAYFHDCDYKDNGWFDLQGDLKFISRLAQNLDRMGDDERVVAKFSINYFSTVGNSLATYKNSLDSKVANEVVTDPTQDDIFPYLMPEFTALDDYKEHRYRFYNGMIEGLKTVEMAQSPLSTGLSTTSTSFQSFQIQQSIENLMVEIF